MKLYYSPGACSLSPHIVAREAGIAVDLTKVDLKAKTLAEGGSYIAVNGKGYVPALGLDDGTLLTEGPVIVQYLADQKPESGLAPKAGTMERLRLQEWLMGDKFSVADAYLFTILNWAPMVKFDLGRWPAISEYQKRVGQRPKVQEALKAEGLVK